MSHPSRDLQDKIDRDIADRMLRKQRLAALRDDQIRHVYPTFGREHVADKRENCWCRPAVAFVEGGAVIIHEAEQ